jgi:hypothetical protein
MQEVVKKYMDHINGHRLLCGQPPIEFDEADRQVANIIFESCTPVEKLEAWLDMPFLKPYKIKDKNMFNTKELKAGDRVFFRCGGTAVVDKVSLLSIYFKDYVAVLGNRGNIWAENGSYEVGGNHMLDIVKVEKAFVWDDVKAGMAFKLAYGEQETLFYVGKVPVIGAWALEGCCVFQEKGSRKLKEIHPNNVKRFPDDDVKFAA